MREGHNTSVPTPGETVQFGFWTPRTGVITGLYEHGPAKYLVKDPAKPESDTSRYIVNFEDCQVVARAEDKDSSEAAYA